MTQELLKEIEQLNELDKKRTQGVLDVSDNYIFIRPECRGGYQRYNLRMEFDNEFKDASNDTEFYSQAPRMLEIINQQQAALNAKPVINWRKYPEEKPELNGTYRTVVVFDDGERWVCTNDYDNSLYEGFYFKNQGVTHWMPESEFLEATITTTT